MRNDFLENALIDWGDAHPSARADRGYLCAASPRQWLCAAAPGPRQKGNVFFDTPAVLLFQNAARATTRVAIGLIPPEDSRSITCGS